MKTMIFALILATSTAHAQTCSVPQPLTDAQKAMVSGKWVGHFELGGVRKDFSVQVDFQSGAEAVTITHPPAEGNINGENLRFCGSGAFHFRKTLAEGYFEFDGVPGEKEMRGSLVVIAKGARTAGDFVLLRNLP